MALKGKIKKISGQRGKINAENGKEYSFTMDQIKKCGVNPQNVQKGYQVEFEPASGPMNQVKKIISINVTVSDKEPKTKTESKEKIIDPNAFKNPYNFVRPQSMFKAKPKPDDYFCRCNPVGHQRFVEHSGSIRCTITNKTPFFIPDDRKIFPNDRKSRTHKTRGYFTLDPVESEWNPDAEDKTLPAIPASSLRGMVRHVFETVTESCFCQLNNTRLDFRFPHPLSAKNDKTTEFLPCRILSIGKITKLQILDGRSNAPSEYRTEIACANVMEYKPFVGQGHNLNNIDNLIDGTPVVAVLKPEYEKKRLYLSCRKTVHASEYNNLSTGGNKVIFGFLHRTGPNMFNKKFEKIFYSWGEWNNFSKNLDERYELFRKEIDNPSKNIKQVSELVVDAFNDSMFGYRDRNNESLSQQPPRKIVPGKKTPYPSDFVNSGKRLTKGDCLYALLKKDDKGNLSVEGLYPVGIPRLAFENTLMNLLPDHLQPCSGFEYLCPACRLFGWVAHGKVDNVKKSAYKGRVMFSPGTITDRKPWSTKKIKRTELAIMGSPSPTTTAFYLERKSGLNSLDHRWPPALRDESRVPFPLYHKEEAILRGRKFYWHHNISQKSIEKTEIPIHPSHTNRGKHLNQTVDLIAQPQSFGFEVKFRNLSDIELGALIFALELVSDSEEDLKMAHKLGMGKPLGMGTCEITINEICLKNYDELFSSFIPKPTSIISITKPEDWRGRFLQKLWDQWLRYTNKKKLRDIRMLNELFEMLNTKPKLDIPIHYPRKSKHPSPDDRNFEWFGNNRLMWPRPGDFSSTKRDSKWLKRR